MLSVAHTVWGVETAPLQVRIPPFESRTFLPRWYQSLVRRVVPFARKRGAGGTRICSAEVGSSLSPFQLMPPVAAQHRLHAILRHVDFVRPTGRR